MIELILGAISRRIMGWGDASRSAGKMLAMAATFLALYPIGLWPSITCAVLIPWVGYALPYHGETMDKPVQMSLRNGAFTAVLAAILFFVFGINAWLYAPVGLLAGPIYALAYSLRNRLPNMGTYLDGWTAYAEHGLGAALVGGLMLV